jgi:large subunit ribosomal protein L4
MPRQMRRAALRSALSTKAAANEIVLVDTLTLAEGKTKLMAKALDALVGNNSALVLIPNNGEEFELVMRASNNLPEAKTLLATYLNVRDLLGFDRLVMPVQAVDVLVSYLG